jgi:hypothetical protein
MRKAPHRATQSFRIRGQDREGARPRCPADAARPRGRGDRMIQSHSARHPAASSVPRWLTICLQWLLFQQMHYHGSESRVMPV